ncbi:MAG: hypothetical protein ACI9UT_003530 [Flavobacteriales bacterium]|jgi:hypothetical protein
MSDNKSNDNNDGVFDLLAHEKIISDLYQNDKKIQAEGPSVLIDSDIMAMAKQQISTNPGLLTKSQTFNHKLSVNKTPSPKTVKKWQWPISLVASVGILGVLFMNQTDYFIYPYNNNEGDKGILNRPAIQAADISDGKTLIKEFVAESSFKKMETAISTQQPEVLLNKELTGMVRKRMSVTEVPKVFKEQVIDNYMLEDHSSKIIPMSLLDMSKLAEVIKLELAIQNDSESQAKLSIVKMQKVLLEHLIQHKKNYTKFNITDKYFSVLTEIQVQQLKSLATEAASEQ